MREAVISTGAITENVQTLRAAIGPVDALAVVKANGYGHGAVQSARAALEGGATWLGVVDLGEAMELRQAGLTVPILTWLHDPAEDFAAAVEHGIDVGVSSVEQVDAAASTGATVHLKVDTGLSRNGAVETEWPEFFAAAARHQAAGRLVVRGLWSHLANTDADAEQVAVFHRAHSMAREAGLDPEVLHIAATNGALTLPESRLTLVRLGIAMYGLGVERSMQQQLSRPLRPAMELAASVASVKRVPAGSGVSYGFDYRTSKETTLALIPLGYADGIPRHASGTIAAEPDEWYLIAANDGSPATPPFGGPVAINGRVYHVVGRVAMDQFVLDVGDDDVKVGDRAVLFGDPLRDVPGAATWALSAGTIDYEIVTRIGPRVPRRYVP
jgi:alanine racemase